MCVSTGPAEFSSTILYCGRRRHPEHGWVEVFGYQNTAVNRAVGPNAMLLHLPARAVSSASFLPVDGAERVLHDMVGERPGPNCSSSCRRGSWAGTSVRRCRTATSRSATTTCCAATSS